MGDPSFELMSENSLSPTDDNLMMVWKSRTNLNTKEIKIAWWRKKMVIDNPPYKILGTALYWSHDGEEK